MNREDHESIPGIDEQADYGDVSSRNCFYEFAWKIWHEISVWMIALIIEILDD